MKFLPRRRGSDRCRGRISQQLPGPNKLCRAWHHLLAFLEHAAGFIEAMRANQQFREGGVIHRGGGVVFNRPLGAKLYSPRQVVNGRGNVAALREFASEQGMRRQWRP